MNIYGNPNQEVNVFEVTKDPSTFRFIGYYGAKFYKFPKNRDYGSNVVEIINTADANLGSTASIIKDENAAELTGLTTFINGSGETVVVSGATAGIQTGDFITDDLDTPSIFLLLVLEPLLQELELQCMTHITIQLADFVQQAITKYMRIRR